MTLFLLSTITGLRDDLKDKLKVEIANRGNKVVYISSTPLGDDMEAFNNVFKAFKSISNFIDVEYIDLSDKYQTEDLRRVVAYGTVYLSDGNAYEFLENANKKSLKSILDEHIKEGGLIIGVGVGAMLLTPTIELARLESVSQDSLSDLTSFDYVEYEFYPHYNENDGHRDMLHDYSSKTRNRVFTCHDGEGVMEVGSVMRVYGDIAELKG